MVTDWVADVAVRRALRMAIAHRLVNATRAGDSIRFDVVGSFALSEMPGINIVSFPPGESAPGERIVNMAVVGVIAEPSTDVSVMDDCGVCVSSLVQAVDEFDNEIRAALSGLYLIEGCAAHCAVTEITPSVLQFSNEGAKPSALIRRLVSAVYIESSES